MITSDSPLELSAEGLPTGEAARAELRGTVFSVGQDARTVSVPLSGYVLAPERLSIPFDPLELDRWGRASFQGELQVSLKRPGAPMMRLPSLRVEFDTDSPDPRAGQQQRHTVDRMLPRLGLVISDAESMGAGLVVAEVHSGGPAYTAGLRVGDLILRSNGVHLQALSELAPGPSAGALALYVRRANGQPATIRLPLGSGETPFADARVLGFCALVGVALWVMALSLLATSPGAALWSMRRRIRARWQVAPRALWLGLGLSASLGAFSVTRAAELEPFALLVLHLGCLVALYGLRELSRSRALHDLVGLWLAVLGVAAVSGTRGWSAILHEQVGAPWAWNVAARPPLTLAMIVCLLHAARLHVEPGVRPSRMLLEQCSRALLALLLAAMFLGGGDAGASRWAAVLGSVSAAAKSGVCYMLLVAIEPAVFVGRRWAALWGSLFVAICSWAWLAPSRALELRIGAAVCVFAVLWLATALLQARRIRAEERAVAPAPMRRVVGSAATS